MAWMIMKIFSLWKLFVPFGHIGLDLLNRANLCVISRTLQLVLTVSAQVFYKGILWGSRVCVCHTNCTQLDLCWSTTKNSQTSEQEKGY